MPTLTIKQIGLAVMVLTLVIGGLYYLSQPKEETLPPVAPPEEVVTEIVTQIGRSVEGRPINAHAFGSGENHLLFVGGIHGGYEWNSSFLAYRFIDYLNAHPDFVPENIKVTIVPVANPDGLYAVVGKGGRFEVTDVPDLPNTTGLGRLNANSVDLNRNFDCKWQPESTWRSQTVSAGKAAFSEPEAAALRDLVMGNKPVAAVFWHSQANTVYGSECNQGILPTTVNIMNAYATAANYAAVPAFNSYPITGDAEGWLASLDIPAITVELKTHDTIEWEQNLAGINALFNYFAE